MTRERKAATDHAAGMENELNKLVQRLEYVEDLLCSARDVEREAEVAAEVKEIRKRRGDDAPPITHGPRDFHKIAALIDANDKRVQIAPLSNVVRLQQTRAGLQVTIGVPGELMGPLSRGELSGGLLLVEPAALESR